MDLERRVGLMLEQNAPREAYRAAIMVNDASLANPAGFPAQDVAHERARIHDAFVKHWFQRVVRNTFGKDVSFDTEEPPFEFTLLATGGYGRDELNPYSDIDLKLVIDQPALQGNRLVEQAAHEGIYTFEKEYGFPIELSCHTLSDLSELSGAGLNTFLDMRQLWGERQIQGESKITQKIRRTLNLTYNPADLFLHNLQAHAELIQKQGPLDDFSAFNIKNGSGGLRIFHIARYLNSLPTTTYTIDEMMQRGPFSNYAQEMRRGVHRLPVEQLNKQEQEGLRGLPDYNEQRAFAVLLQTRSWLNIRRKQEGADKNQKDILCLQDFKALSPKMREAVATARHTIANYFEQTKRKKLGNGLQIPFGEYSFVLTTEGINNVEDKVQGRTTKQENERGHRLLHLAQEKQLPLHSQAIEQLAKITPSPLFIEGLKMKQPFMGIANTLHTTGNLPRVIPGFETLYGSLRGTITDAGRALKRLKTAEKLIAEKEYTADERAILRYVTLIADIPLETQGQKLLEYPGLHEERGRDVLFLLTQRDLLLEKGTTRLSDQATIQEIANVCETSQRLELLHSLTKILNTGNSDFPEYIWSNIGELVQKTRDTYNGQRTRKLPRGILSEAGERLFEDLGHDFHSSRYARRDLSTWISLLEKVQERGKPIIKKFNVDWPLVGVAAHNKDGLLAALTGTFYTAGINLRQAHAYTLSESGLALDFFETENITDERGKELAELLIKNASSLELPEIQPRTILQPLQGKAQIIHQKQAGYYVLEYVSEKDSQGILYALTRALSENLSASIWGMNAHAKPGNAVEDRVFFTLPEQQEAQEIERQFKETTGIH